MVEADITDQRQAAAAVGTVVAQLGRLDTVVNNAGFMGVGQIVDSPRGVADLVNISSTAGRVARPGTAVYNLTKFGVNGFTEALRQEAMQKHVRVSVVEPGTVDTELSTHLRDGVRQRGPRTSRRADLVAVDGRPA